MYFEDLERALELFALSDRTTLREIKSRHRSLVRRYHSDVGEQPDTDKMKEVNAAYRILMDYCSDYRFSFTREEFYRQNPEAHLREQFGGDFLWSRDR